MKNMGDGGCARHYPFTLWLQGDVLTSETFLSPQQLLLTFHLAGVSCVVGQA